MHQFFPVGGSNIYYNKNINNLYFCHHVQLVLVFLAVCAVAQAAPATRPKFVIVPIDIMDQLTGYRYARNMYAEVNIDYG